MNKSYFSTISALQPADRTLEDVLTENRANAASPRWRKLKANRISKILEKLSHKKIGDISKKEIDTAFTLSKFTRLDQKSLRGHLNRMLKVASGQPARNSPKTANIETSKIKHFTIDHKEVEILLKQRNSRFASILKEIREQVLVLPGGQDFGFYPNTKDNKEIKSIIHGINPTVNELGFVTRYIKSENAIVLIRKKDVQKGVTKNGN